MLTCNSTSEATSQKSDNDIGTIYIGFVREFLQKAKVNIAHATELKAIGFAELEDFVDAEDETLLKAGLTTTEVKRLKRYSQKEAQAKETSRPQRHASAPGPANPAANSSAPTKSVFTGGGHNWPTSKGPAAAVASDNPTPPSKEPVRPRQPPKTQKGFKKLLIALDKIGPGDSLWAQENGLVDEKPVAQGSTPQEEWHECQFVVGKQCKAAANGSFLTIFAKNRIKVTGIAVGTPYKPLENWNLSVYARSGQSRGHERSREGWSLEGSVFEPASRKPDSASGSQDAKHIKFDGELSVEKGDAIGLYLHSPESNYAVVLTSVDKANLENEDLQLQMEYRHEDAEAFNIKTVMDRRYVPAISIHYEVHRGERKGSEAVAYSEA